ncbi:hypothetical protein DL95DRAFT_417852 [Leptodontidium sp. 2 PMI_412]|nr:hypothetical protein DL95DRAFT_417852 [Leptodontidium sp. 2 PMI_412]
MSNILLSSFAKFSTQTDVSCALAAGVGLVSHWSYFIRGQKTMEVVKIVALHALALTLLLSSTTSALGFYRGIITFAEISGSYFLALFTSIGIYRLLFHSLKNTPGPFLAKVTKFYYQWLTAYDFAQPSLRPSQPAQAFLLLACPPSSYS